MSLPLELEQDIPVTSHGLPPHDNEQVSNTEAVRLENEGPYSGKSGDKSPQISHSMPNYLTAVT